MIFKDASITKIHRFKAQHQSSESIVMSEIIFESSQDQICHCQLCVSVLYRNVSMIVCCFGSLFSRRGFFITTFFNKFRLSILFDKIRKYSTLFDIIRQHSTKFCNFRHYSTSLQHNAINILPLNFVAGFALSRGPVWEWGEGAS